jgi:hypothetical protein
MHFNETDLEELSGPADLTAVGLRNGASRSVYNYAAGAILTPEHVRKQGRPNLLRVDQHEPGRIAKHVVAKHGPHVALPGAGLLGHLQQDHRRVQVVNGGSPDNVHPCDDSHLFEVKRASGQVIE